MQLEVRFFTAVPGVPARRAVGILVVDFDETLTEADTTPSIIATAIDAAEASASGATCTYAASPSSLRPLAGVWNQEACTLAGELKAEVRWQREALRDQLVANYAREREALLVNILPKVPPTGHGSSAQLPAPC